MLVDDVLDRRLGTVDANSREWPRDGNSSFRRGNDEFLGRIFDDDLVCRLLFSGGSQSVLARMSAIPFGREKNLQPPRRSGSIPSSDHFHLARDETAVFVNTQSSDIDGSSRPWERHKGVRSQCRH